MQCDDPFEHSQVAATIFKHLQFALLKGGNLSKLACEIAEALNQAYGIDLGPPEPKGPEAEIIDLFDFKNERRAE